MEARSWLRQAKFVNYLIIALGGLVSAAGVTFVAMYVWEAIVARWGDPDQSLIFWYLPILLFGVIGIRGGIAIIAFGRNRLENAHHSA